MKFLYEERRKQQHEQKEYTNLKNKKEKIEVGLLYHAVRINIHNKASKERE